MKTRYLFLIIGGLFLARCATGPKVAYQIPANYPEERRKELTEILEKGQKLYKDNCSDCHGIFTKGKDKIPNFTTTQLDNYSSRFIRRDPKSHAVVANMSHDQLNSVLTFLRFKKTSTVDSTSGRKKRA